MYQEHLQRIRTAPPVSLRSGRQRTDAAAANAAKQVVEPSALCRTYESGLIVLCALSATFAVQLTAQQRGEERRLHRRIVRSARTVERVSQ